MCGKIQAMLGAIYDMSKVSRLSMVACRHRDANALLIDFICILRLDAYTKDNSNQVISRFKMTL